MTDFDKYYQIAKDVNKVASTYLLANFGASKEMFQKGKSNHYGIDDDNVVNKIYQDYLKKMTPEVDLYTEEGERNLGQELTWVIDPIEGTSNYRVGNPFFATQIALLYKKEPVVAVVNAPVLNQLFTAVKSKGAYLNDRKISCSKLKKMEMVVVEIGRGRSDSDKEWAAKMLAKIAQKTRTIRVFGATGLSLAYLAAGMTDIYLNKGSELYDYLPGALVVREAGGKVVNFEGNDWNLSDSNLLASNDFLAEKMEILLKGI